MSIFYFSGNTRPSYDDKNLLPPYTYMHRCVDTVMSFSITRACICVHLNLKSYLSSEIAGFGFSYSIFETQQPNTLYPFTSNNLQLIMLLVGYPPNECS